MENSEIISLDKDSLKEVNGGSQYSYESGLWAGDAIRKWIMAVGIIRFFI